MKVLDESAWQARRAALVEDGETGKAFLAFVELWVGIAEEFLKMSTDGIQWAMRHSLERTEFIHGRCSAFHLGQMLAVLIEHWKYGEKLRDSLSPIELRLVEDLTLLKIAEVQIEAQQHVNDPLMREVR